MDINQIKQQVEQACTAHRKLVKQQLYQQRLQVMIALQNNPEFQSAKAKLDAIRGVSA